MRGSQSRKAGGLAAALSLAAALAATGFSARPIRAQAVSGAFAVTDNNLWEIDLTSGMAHVFAGPLTPAGTQVEALAFDTSGQFLFGVDVATDKLASFENGGGTVHE